MFKIRRGSLAVLSTLSIFVLAGAFSSPASENTFGKLEIIDGPTLTNPSDPTTIFPGTLIDVQVSAQGRSFRTIELDFGDGTSPETTGIDFGITTMLFAMHSYSSDGTFTITAKAFHGPTDNPEKIKTIKTLQVVVNEIPKPIVTDITDGVAPYTLSLDASATQPPTGATVSSYTFETDITDPTSSTTQAGSVFTTVLNTTGEFVARVTANYSNGQSASLSLPYVISDGLTGNGDAAFSKGAFTDTGLKLSGDFPNAGTNDFSGATVALQINGQSVAPATSVRSRSSARDARAKGFSFIPIIGSNGKFSLKLSGGNLRNAFGLRKQNGKRRIRSEVAIDVGGTTAATSRVRGIIEADFTETDSGKAKGKFSFITLGTPTGAFKSQRTSARLGKSGGYSITGKGPILGQLSQPIDPTGDLVITIGDSTTSVFETITIPLASFVIKGTAPKQTYTYSSKLGAVTGLKKFQINNAKRNFTLATDELTNTGIPGTGAGGTAFNLPIVISTTTSGGLRQLTTNVNILRKDTSSGSWKR